MFEVWGGEMWLKSEVIVEMSMEIWAKSPQLDGIWNVMEVASLNRAQGSGVK